MHLPPIFYHYFHSPLPYSTTLVLQETLHVLQLAARNSTKSHASHPDLLLLLQHRPVYTAGRRQHADSTQGDRRRLTNTGADFVSTARGGEYTFHGPGQIVGYPLLDLGRTSPAMGIRDYICRMQKTLEVHLKEAHGLDHVPSDHTGVFLDAHTKVASIGVQVRHRLTTHGFAMNITREPEPWFDRVVACGLDGVRAGSIESATNTKIRVEDEIPGLVSRFGRMYEREMVPLDLSNDGPIITEIKTMEQMGRDAGDWKSAPM
ncbi:hypothetical protein EDD85DRAFT_944299 [Armillaria nabsnona]|nr:hypothetical protein EDD85DRAFT_944299 [Armillaria nabsnona]